MRSLADAVTNPFAVADKQYGKLIGGTEKRLFQNVYRLESDTIDYQVNLILLPHQIFIIPTDLTKFLAIEDLPDTVEIFDAPQLM